MSETETVKPEDKYIGVNDLRLHYLDWGSLRIVAVDACVGETPAA